MAGEELLELVTIVFISSELYYAKEGGGGGGANHKESSDKRKSSSGYVGFSKKNLHELIFVNKYCYTKCVGSIIALCENYFIYNVKNLNELECTKTVKANNLLGYLKIKFILKRWANPFFLTFNRHFGLCANALYFPPYSLNLRGSLPLPLFPCDYNCQMSVHFNHKPIKILSHRASILVYRYQREKVKGGKSARLCQTEMIVVPALTANPAEDVEDGGEAACGLRVEDTTLAQPREKPVLTGIAASSLHTDTWLYRLSD